MNGDVRNFIANHKGRWLTTPAFRVSSFVPKEPEIG